MAVTNNFAPGTLIESSKVNQNFTDCVLKDGSQPATKGSFTLESSDPGSLTEGQIWYNTTDKQLKLYNGSATVILG